MPSLDDRFRLLLQARGPDLWRGIEVREPAQVPARVRRADRLLAAVTALLLAGAGIFLGVRAFQGTRAPSRSATGPTPSGRLVGSMKVGPNGQVTSVLEAAGSVWVTAYGVPGPEDEAVIRIDPESQKVLATIPVQGVPAWETGGGGLAYGAGSFWVVGQAPAASGRDAVLYRIDPATNNVVATISLGGVRGADVIVDGTTVWTAFFGEESAQVARIDSRTNRIVATIPLTSDYVRRIVEVNGSVFAEEIEFSGDGVVSGTLIEAINPQTNQVIASSSPVSVSPTAGIAGWDGELWAGSDAGFTRLDPDTLKPASDLVPVPHGVCCMLFESGPEGIWFVDLNSRLILFDPRMRSANEVLDVSEEGPIATATAPNRVWLLGFDGTLSRIDLVW